MKNRYKIIVAAIVLSLPLISCQKEMMDYIGVDGVYFSVQPRTLTAFGDPDIWPVVDTSSVPFAKTKSADSVYNLKVKIIGSVKDYDRTFGMKVGQTSTAVEGRDFDKVPERFTVPAGKVFINVPLLLHRSETMKEEDLLIVLELVETEDFRVPIYRYFTSSTQQSDTVVVSKHVVIVNDKLYRPKTWNDYQAGAYSDAKMQLICDLFNLNIGEFDDQKTTMPSKRFVSIILALRNYLNVREKEGNPVYETDSKGNIIYTTGPNGEKIPVKMKVGNLSVS